MKPQKILMQTLKILTQTKMILILDSLQDQLLERRAQLKKSYLRFYCPTIKYS